MATDLTGLQVRNTYNSLLKIGDNTSLTGIAKRISDGLGNDSPLFISTSQISIGVAPATGYDLTVNSGIRTGSIDVLGAATAQSLQFTGGGGTQGTMSWNTDEETVDLIQNGATLQLGQETHVHVKNQSGATINDGTPVYVTGTLGASGRLTVAPMIADGSIPAKYFLGVTTEDIPNGEDGKVTTFGKIRGLDTTAYTEGQTLYVSSTTAGFWQTTPPVAPALDLEVAIVINVSANNGTLFVRAQNGQYLGLLHDVYLNSVADNQMLVYNATNSRWENQGIASIGAINLDTVTDNGNTTTNNISVGDINAGNVTLTGYLRGAANFVIDPAAHGDETGVVQILGDLRVDGTTTTINSTTVTIADKNIVLAQGSALPGDANGAGITIDGAAASMTYNSTSDRFVFNKDIETNLVGNVTGNLTGNVTGAASLNVLKAGDTMTGDLDFNDNVKAKFGTGDDLTVYHNATNSLIDNATGSILIRNLADDQDIVLVSDDGAGSITDYLRVDGSEGSVKLFHYGSEKLVTTATGVSVTGAFSGNLNTSSISGSTIDINGTTAINLQYNGSTQLRIDTFGVAYLGTVTFANDGISLTDEDSTTDSFFHANVDYDAGLYQVTSNARYGADYIQVDGLDSRSNTRFTISPKDISSPDPYAYLYIGGNNSNTAPNTLVDWHTIYMNALSVRINNNEVATQSWVTSQNYLTAEADTLQSVTDRNATTTNGIIIGGATVNGLITLPQNPVGTTYGNGVATVPSYMFQQTAGDNDGIRMYAESAATNDVRFIFEVVDDIETGDTWIFRNKKTYTDYLANEVVKISGAGDITASGTLSASGYNNSNWDTAFSWGNHADAGYITSYTETDTLDSVTDRGAITTNSITVGNITGNAAVFSSSIDGADHIWTTNGNSTYTNPHDTNVPLLAAYNNSNSNANAHAILSLRTGGSSGGDPFISLDVEGEAGWSVGMDNSDGNKFKISSDWDTLANQNKLTITTGGAVGIGTDSPNQKLTINGGTNSVWSYSTATTEQPGFVAANNIDFGSQTSLLYAKIYGSGISASAFGVTLGNYAVVATDGSSNNGLLLGTFNNKPIIIGTNSSERIRVTSDGKVGIGETSPSEKFEVKQNTLNNVNSLTFNSYTGLNSSYQVTKLTINASATNTSGNNGIAVINMNTRNPSLNGNHGTSAFITMRNLSGGSYGNGQFDFFIRNDSAPYAFDGDPNAGSSYWMDSLMTIKSDGKIGIGTDSPSSKLDVRGGIVSYGTNNYFLTGASTNDHIQLQWNDAGGHGKLLTRQGGIYYDNTLVLKSGNVGIGTTTPGYKLDVQGSMLATSSVRMATSTDAGVTVGDYHHSSGSSSDTKLILAGKNLQSGSSYYGDYGQLLFRASSNYTGSARQWLVTNAVDAYKFSIIMGNSGQALPTIGAAGSVSNGTPVITITDSTAVGIRTINPAAQLEVAASDTEGILVSGGTNGRSVFVSSTAVDLRVTTTAGYAMALRATTSNSSAVLGQIAGVFGTSPTAATYFYYGGTNYNSAAIYIPTDKTVGIGVTPNGATLHVSGQNLQYSARFQHARANSANNYDDTIFLENTNQNNGNYACVGFSTKGSDGQHHRAQIRAYYEGYVKGTLRFYMRDGSNPVERFRMEPGGKFHAANDIIAFSTTPSDERLKDDIVTIDSALDKVKSLRGVEYTWNKGGREGQRDLGLIAQEVEQVFPEIVRENRLPLLDDSDNTYKTVDYEKLVPVLIEAIKEQQKQIDELKAKLDA